MHHPYFISKLQLLYINYMDKIKPLQSLIQGWVHGGGERTPSKGHVFLYYVFWKSILSIWILCTSMPISPENNPGYMPLQ